MFREEVWQALQMAEDCLCQGSHQDGRGPGGPKGTVTSLSTTQETTSLLPSAPADLGRMN